VPKKESKERFSSMITTTWQIRWMPRRGEGHRLPAAPVEGEEPQPATALAASRSARDAASLS
jgi:hypothetical protein